MFILSLGTHKIYNLYPIIPSFCSLSYTLEKLFAYIISLYNILFVCIICSNFKHVFFPRKTYFTIFNKCIV